MAYSCPRTALQRGSWTDFHRGAPFFGGRKRYHQKSDCQNIFLPKFDFFCERFLAQEADTGRLLTIYQAFMGAYWLFKAMLWA